MADSTERMFNVVSPTTPMQIDIQTQKCIDTNIKLLDMKPVTNTISFERGNIPTDDGLFSKSIFGITQEERRKTFAYIDLHTKIIHPQIYEVLTFLQQNIKTVCSGKGSWKIDSDNQLVPVPEDSPEYNPNNTGMDWFIKNYSKIKFKKNKSRERAERLALLETFGPDEIFIDKWVVMPVFYRDAESSAGGGPKKLPPINNQYIDLIRYAKSLEMETVGFVSNIAKFNIQTTCLAIHRYFRGIIEKSGGFFKQYVVGKAPDYGARAVISCMVLDQYDKPSECPIDMNSTGIPLSQVLITLLPFIKRWVYHYFDDFFVSTGDRMTTYSSKTGKYESVLLDNPRDKYTSEYIVKRINGWIDNFESRFDPVLMPVEGGKELPVAFTGRTYQMDRDNPKAATISNRVLTWCDILYMAAVEVSGDKHVWITRYPIISYNGTFPSRIHVMSTVNTMKCVMPIHGIEKIFPYYPVIDPTLPKEVVATSFNDTINMSNLYLEGIGGDYDGDMVSDRVPFTVEANEECEEILHSMKQYLTAQGKLIRSLGNEAYLTIYNMTTDEPAAGMASEEAKRELLSYKSEDLGCRLITQLFGTTADPATKKIKPPKYNHRSRVLLKAGECGNAKEENTTLGRILFNKLFITPYIRDVIPGGFINQTMTKKDIGKLSNTVATAAEYGKLTTDDLWPWLKAMEFYSFKLVTIFSPSYTYNLLTPYDDIIKKRNEFFEKNPNPSTVEVKKLELELVKMAQGKLGDDPGVPLFTSGAKGSFEDNYKNISVMLGPMYNPINGQWDVVKSSYVEGLKKEDIPVMGNMCVNAQYPKSVATADSGYTTKQFYAAFQNSRVAPDGTDCHSTGYLTIKLTEENFGNYEFQNIITGPDKYETLTLDNKSKYVGKTIKLRSPMTCIYKDCICSACAGRRPYITDMPNVGIQFSTAPNVLVNAGMKKFHVSTVKLDIVDPNSLII